MNGRQILSVTTTLLFSTCCVAPSKAASRAEYINNAFDAANVLNQYWYNSVNGQWQDLWWNSANVITMIANLVSLCSDDTMSIARYFFENTFVTASAFNGGSFLYEFYDDEGWWAMAWIRIYDLTQNHTYIDAATEIFSDMANGRIAPCGGRWWSKDKNANTAIGNELYIAVAASLANRVADQRPYSEDVAVREMDWFLKSSLLNTNNTISDHLNLNNCTPTGTVFTYNQGVILGALIELYRLRSNQTYLDTASKIAYGAMDHLTDNTGILSERGYPGLLDSTSSQFKGVFARNLAYLHSIAPDDAYVSFLQRNADAIWSHDQQDGKLGPHWQGPYLDTSAPSQSSGLDCLVAAAAVSS